MNRIFNFVREKAFVLILLGSILAAAGTGLWAINTVQRNLNQMTKPEDGAPDDFAGFEDAQQGGDDLWDEPADMVTDEMNGEVAMQAQPDAQEPSEEAAGKQDEASDGASAPTDASSVPSGSPSLSEPSEASAVLEPQLTTGTASFVLPVSGAILQDFSGDELVYNETLGDWRTHNGVDYAAALGEEVISPIEGQVLRVYDDGNWCGVVEIADRNGCTWRFCGVENSPLQEGDDVSISEAIGAIGQIGAESAAQPHLHLEIVQEGKYQNPSEFLK